MLRTLTLTSIAVLFCGGGVHAMQGEEWIYLSDLLGDSLIVQSQGWGVLGIDTCTHAPEQTPLPLQLGQTRYEKGVGTHAPGEIVLDLGGQFAAFEAEVGVQWQQGTTGSVEFTIEADGRKLYESGVLREADGARYVRVDLSGADTLRLVCGDAGDGITCDAANWAKARLLRDRNASARPAGERVDVGLFAEVVTSDPHREDGCRASRTEEFLADDVFLTAPVAPNADGLYEVPTAEDGAGAIGLEWIERRMLREASLRFAEGSPMPDAAGARLEFWAGESRWQGGWKTLESGIEVEGREWRSRFSCGGELPKPPGAWKIRWVIPPQAQPVIVERPSAWTRSRWAPAEVRLYRTAPSVGPGSVEVYNGRIDGTGEWALDEPLSLKVLHNAVEAIKGDRTMLRVRVPEGMVTLAVDDILANPEIYVPEFHLLASTGPVPSARIERIVAEVEEGRTLRECVNAMPDQTYAQAMERVHIPEHDTGPTMLSLACDNRKFLLERDGTLGPLQDVPPETVWVPGIPRVWQVTPLFQPGKTVEHVRSFDCASMPPTILMETADGDLCYTQYTYVAPVGKTSRRACEGAVCVSDLSLENTDSDPLAAEFGLALSGADGLVFSEEADGAFAIRLGGALVGRVLTSADGGLTIAGDGVRLTVTGEAAPEATTRLTVLIGDEAALNAADATKLHAAARDYWTPIMGEAMQVSLPDADLTELIRASQVHCLMAARNEAEGERIAAWIASILYGPIDTEPHSIILGMDEFGHHEFSERSLEFFRERYRDKDYLAYGYTLIGTGQHLWTLARHWDLTGDRDWMNAVAPDVSRLCAWIVRQREKTERLGLDGEPAPEYGLLPPGVVADWSAFQYRHYAQGQYHAGLADAGRALAEAGRPEAAGYVKDAGDFRRQILRAYEWTRERSPVVPLADGAWAPHAPSMVDCFGPVADQYAGEDANRSWAADVEIGPHQLAPLGVMDPHAPEMTECLDYLEDYWLLLAGWGYYTEEANREDWFSLGGFGKIQPYYGRTPDCYALRDEVKPYIRAYFNAIPSLLNREDLSLYEHFHTGGNYNKTHETGWFLHQSRQLLVQERGRELWLAPFAPTGWYEDGKTIEVSQAPTEFGSTSYRIESHLGENCVTVTIDPPGREAPEAIVIRLRPEGRAPKSATATGAEVLGVDTERECIRLKPTGGPIEVRVEF